MPSTAVPRMLQLESVGDDRFVLPNAANEVRDVVFGGQLLAQMIVAASETAPGKHVKSIHAVFARPARTTSELELQSTGSTTGGPSAPATPR
jgi:acyl-CoA thioesterase